MLQKLHSSPQAVHWPYKFLSSKYHCPLNSTLKIITLKLNPKQSKLFCVLNSLLKLRLDCTGKGCTDVTIKAKKSVLHYLYKNGSSQWHKWSTQPKSAPTKYTSQLLSHLSSPAILEIMAWFILKVFFMHALTKDFFHLNIHTQNSFNKDLPVGWIWVCSNPLKSGLRVYMYLQPRLPSLWLVNIPI